MASTLYLPNSGAAPPISPTPSASWGDTSILARRPMSITKAGTALATIAYTESTDGADKNVLFRQHVLDQQLAAQTILAQTITWQIRAIESNGNNNLFLALVLRVFASDGTTVRGTLLALTRDATELNPASLQNRSFTATSTQVISQAGDYLVAETGAGGDPGGATPVHNCSLRFGDSAATDLPVDDTTTTDLNPWLRFANDLSFYVPPTVIARRTLHGTGARMGSRGL